MGNHLLGDHGMSEQFKAGDTVKLKSGGPLMTVTQSANDPHGVPHVWTVYFDSEQKEATGYYPAAAVVAADPEKPKGF